MKILLTGGTGMVGRNLLEHPEISKFQVLAPNRTELDLRTYEKAEAYLKAHRPDMVIHAAAKVGGIHANMTQMVDFLVENLDVGRNVLMACVNTGIKRVLNLGSSCIYPRAAENPLRESSILTGELEPTNEGYALAKLTAMRLCQYINKQYPGFEYKTLLACNLYGRYDKFDPGQSHLVPAILHKLHQAKQQGQGQIEIWGKGDARREFMYAGDFADCILRVIERWNEAPELMNVGLGHDFTINEYYAAGVDVVGAKVEFVHDLAKPVGMMRKLLNVERQNKFGWAPKTSLVEGMQKTYEYYTKEVVK
jgi:GDP-L-fucose synthase